MNILGIASIIMLCSRLWIPDGIEGKIESLVQLPTWECDQCILQWTYRNGKIIIVNNTFSHRVGT